MARLTEFLQKRPWLISWTTRVATHQLNGDCVIQGRSCTYGIYYMPWGLLYTEVWVHGATWGCSDHPNDTAWCLPLVGFIILILSHVGLQLIVNTTWLERQGKQYENPIQCKDRLQWNKSSSTDTRMQYKMANLKALRANLAQFIVPQLV